MKLRPYTPADLEPLLKLWWESWHSSATFTHPKPLTEWRLRWGEILRDHDVVVAEGANGLLGFAAVNVEEAVLSQLFVDPNAKRKGIGELLFRWAAARSAGRLRLKTLTENSEARGFYAHLGMIERGTSFNEFNGREEIEYAL